VKSNDLADRSLHTATHEFRHHHEIVQRAECENRLLTID
jgi:hypothetical protein